MSDTRTGGQAIPPDVGSRAKLRAVFDKLAAHPEVTVVRRRLSSTAPSRSLALARDEFPEDLLSLYAAMNGCVFEWELAAGRRGGQESGGYIHIPTIAANLRGFADQVAMELEDDVPVRVIDQAPIMAGLRPVALFVGRGRDGLHLFDGTYAHNISRLGVAAFIEAAIASNFVSGWASLLAPVPDPLVVARVARTRERLRLPTEE